MQKHPSLMDRIDWRIRRACLAKPARQWAAYSKTEPLVIAGLFSTASGIGQAARTSLEALRGLGYNPLAVDISSVFAQRDLPVSPDFSPMPEGKSGTLILHVNAPETQRALDGLGMHLTRNWRTIGAWAWELPVAPPAWLGAAAYLSEIWTPSDFVTDVFAPHLKIPVRTVPHHIAVPDNRPSVHGDVAGLGVQDDDLLCLIMADGRSSFERKNVFAATQMYLDAFAGTDGPILVIKSRNLSEYPEFEYEISKLIKGHARIKLLDRALDQATLRALQARCDILLSPHRSEGFGLHLAECMAYGCAVIATGWSGNMQFTKAGGAELLPYRLIRVNDPFNVYPSTDENLWAEPEHEAGVQALRKLAGDAAYRAQMGLQARRDIARYLGVQAYQSALAKASGAA